MKYYMGIDAGGSKTYALITNSEGTILGMGRGGNGNHQNNRDQAEESLQSAVSHALRHAQLTADQIEFAWFGLAGADRESDYRILRPIIQKMNLPNTDISCDTSIALRAGTNQPYGVVLICGTGVNCSGINRKGESFQCGGFGYMFGDFGGGQDLSIEVFRSVIRAWEGREEETRLSNLLINKLGYESVEVLRDNFLDHSKHLPVEIARLLFDAVQQGDEVARRILMKQGEELGLAAAATINRLAMNEETFDIVLAGSILTRGDQFGLLRSIIERKAKQAAPHCSITLLNTEPAVGALILAMESSGEEVSPDIMNNLTKLKINSIRNIRNIQNTN
ncbi:N-acetylglucosamine kinase [Bacillus sp. FJAT-28004]|uniref:N-acetylglucosamine kinase n=1 Tax=Bacillus sp. FJAT-28004 TaxID=1679165 RepID=UPI0006B415A8|nr:BadF/BadG/BcrA/BcrD ATPase family protein [Bacillus sp. FJAT-28004]